MSVKPILMKPIPNKRIKEPKLGEQIGKNILKMKITDILTDPQDATHIKKQTKRPRTDCSSSGDAVEIKIDKQDHSCQRKGSRELNSA